MKKLIIAAFTIASIQSASPANAMFYDGNDVLRFCGSEQEDVMQCAGFIVGVVDSFNRIPNRTKGCFETPEGATVRQLRDVVVKWLEAHPEDRHLPGAGLVMLALNNAFPCPK